MAVNNYKIGPWAVVCTKGSGVNGLGIIRSLGRRNIPVAVIATEGKKNLAVVSRYCSRAYFLNVINESSLIKTLMEIGKQQELAPLLFVDNDYMMWLVGEKAKQLEDIYLFTTPMYRSQELLDKKWQLEQATLAGIPVPQSWFPECWEDFQEIQIQGKRLVAKPRSVASAVNFPFKILGANSPQDLCAKLKKNVNSPRGLVIQEMIEGPDKNVWFALGYSDFRSSKIQIATGVKIVQTGIGFGGVMAAGELRHCKKICKLVERFLEKIDYKGIFGVEMKYDTSTAEYYFIEISPRTERFHIISLLAGLDLPAMAYEELSGKFLTLRNAQKKKEYWGCWIDGTGVRNKFGRRTNLLQLVGLVLRYQSRMKCAVFDSKDLAPLTQKMKNYITSMPNRLWKILHRIVK